MAFSPRLFDIPFATSGELIAVPDPAQGSGSVSYTQGYGVLYETPVESGGFVFPRGQHNQILFDITTFIAQIQQNGVPLWYAGMSTSPLTGYPQYARVLYTDGNVYTSLINNNTDTPPSANWQLSSLSGGIPEHADTGATYAPAASDLGKIIVRSNSGSAMTDTLPGTSGALASSWFAYYANNDASAIATVGVGSGGSIAVGNQATGNKFNVAPGEIWLVISVGSGNYIANRIASAVLHAAPPKGDFKNLVGTWASNTTVTYTADEIVVEDTNKNTKKISALSITLNTATSGAGGVTSAIAANTCYAVWAILNPTTGAQSAILDTSFTAPTLPTGYTFAGLIGSWPTDSSSHLYGGQQNGREFGFLPGLNQAGAIILASGVAGSVTTPTWVGVSISALAPTGILSKVNVSMGTGNTAVGIVAVAPNANSGAYNSTTNMPPLAFENSTQAGWNMGELVLPAGATSIYWASNTADGYMILVGYTLNL